MSVSSMILLGLSNQHVLGRFITCQYSLSKHKGANRGVYSETISSFKIDRPRQRCQAFCIFSPKAEIKENIPHPTATPSLQTPVPGSSEDTDKENMQDT